MCVVVPFHWCSHLHLAVSSCCTLPCALAHLSILLLVHPSDSFCLVRYVMYIHHVHLLHSLGTSSLLWRGSARKRELQPHGILWVHYHCRGKAVHASVNCSHTVLLLLLFLLLLILGYFAYYYCFYALITEFELDWPEYYFLLNLILGSDRVFTGCRFLASGCCLSYEVLSYLLE